ncbi:MAG TPA: hypothetical protein VG326_09340 [Tepidisphaeraceae bacterium]|jgi:hypothetical protein|nr:hypothetical protein [Tepidisphaeraceae bacterium]
MDELSLNMFQRLVRSWEAVHPYNAAQALKLSGAPDQTAINAAWHRSLAAFGLGRVRASGSSFGYEILNGDAHRFPVGSLSIGTSLQTHLSAALNQPFHDENEPPLRPFFIPLDGAYYLGLTYRHWIADSASIRLLLREWCARLIDPALAAENPPRLGREGYWDLYGPRRGRLRVDQAILSLFRSHMRFRTVQKVHMVGAADFPMRVLLRELPFGAIGAVRLAARRRGATVGDVLQAALAVACHRHVPLQRRPQRRDIAIGNIVDLRKHSDRDLSNAFGFYLGFTHVACRRQDMGDFDRVLRSVSQQNSARRRDGIAQHSLGALIAGLVAERLGKPRNVYRLYRKEIPMAAGLSNVNLDGSWPEKIYPDPLLQYIRVSPTGPMAPLVLTTTTLRSQMQIALTYRSGLFSELDAERVSDTVIELISRLSP